MADDATEQPWDGVSFGEIRVREQWIASAYHRDDILADKFDDGWLRTGDVRAITSDGFIAITDRSRASSTQEGDAEPPRGERVRR